MTVETFDIEIQSIKVLAPSVKSFVFSRVDRKELVYQPGQWVNLVLPVPSGEIRRAYSIASAPDGTPNFEVAVTEVSGGPGSGYLCGLEPGARLAPSVRKVSSRAIPTSARLRSSSRPEPASRLFARCCKRPRGPDSSRPSGSCSAFAARSISCTAPSSKRSQASHPNFRAFFTLSQGEAEWTGRRGYVQTHIADLWAELTNVEKGEPHIYVCGLERMITAVRHLVRKEMGIPRERVHSERYD